MKKISFVFILVLLALMGFSQYKPSITLGARANVSTFRNSSIKYKDVTVNPELFAALNIPASPSVAFVLEPSYTTTGSRFGTFDERPRVYDLRLRYAKLPIMLSIGKGDGKFLIGYYEAYLLDKVTIGNSFNANYSFYSSHWVANRSDRGAIAGFDLYLNPVKWTTRLTYGIRKIGKQGYNVLDNEKNIAVSSGLSITL